MARLPTRSPLSAGMITTTPYRRSAQPHEDLHRPVLGSSFWCFCNWKERHRKRVRICSHRPMCFGGVYSRPRRGVWLWKASAVSITPLSLNIHTCPCRLSRQAGIGSSSVLHRGRHGLGISWRLYAWSRWDGIYPVVNGGKKLSFVFQTS